MVEGFEVTKESLALSPLPDETMDTDPSESGSDLDSDASEIVSPQSRPIMNKL